MPKMETSEIPDHDFEFQYGLLMEEVRAYRSALAALRRSSPRQFHAEHAVQFGDPDH